jgi:hypothetical protein
MFPPFLMKEGNGNSDTLLIVEVIGRGKCSYPNLILLSNLGAQTLRCIVILRITMI